jgi:hypothetical protein
VDKKTGLKIIPYRWVPGSRHALYAGRVLEKFVHKGTGDNLKEKLSLFRIPNCLLEMWR